jgi:dihydropyrimidinase
MPLLIQNGEIITADARYTADIYIEDQTISQIGHALTVPEGTEIVDATGKYVFPGFIDPHVHIFLPFMATHAKDTHQTGSIAALIGGTTTYLEMCCPSRHDDTLAGYTLWKSKAEGNSACDYSFHMSVTKFDDTTAAQLREIVADGINSFKVFLSYKNFFGVDDGELYQTLTLAKELGVIVTAHCENAELVGQLQQSLLVQGKTSSAYHEASRPVQVEAEGTNRFATFLEMTGATGYVVHLSCAAALERAISAKTKGIPLFIESVIPHFLLDKTYAEREGVAGAQYVMSPPLRDKSNQKPLWDALEQGFIDTIGTDHCPFDLEQKALGTDAFTAIPNGLPAIEDRVNLLYTYGVSRGKLDLHRFVEAASTKAAKIFGLFPQKGCIAVGSDADLVIYDPSYRGTISTKTHSMNVDNSVFEGWEMDGRPSLVTVRGKIQVRDGKFVGDGSRGKLLRRKPMYF